MIKLEKYEDNREEERECECWRRGAETEKRDYGLELTVKREMQEGKGKKESLKKYRGRKDGRKKYGYEMRVNVGRKNGKQVQREKSKGCKGSKEEFRKRKVRKKS